MNYTLHGLWLAARPQPRADPRGTVVPDRADRMTQRAFGRGYARGWVISPLLGVRSMYIPVSNRALLESTLLKT